MLLYAVLHLRDKPLHGRALRRAVLAKRRKIERCAAGCGVAGLILFGSVARGVASSESDVDVYVAFPGPRDIGVPTRLESCLSRLLDRKVHLTTSRCSEPWIASALKRDGIPLDSSAMSVLQTL